MAHPKARDAARDRADEVKRKHGDSVNLGFGSNKREGAAVPEQKLVEFLEGSAA